VRGGEIFWLLPLKGSLIGLSLTQLRLLWGRVHPSEVIRSRWRMVDIFAFIRDVILTTKNVDD